MSLNKTNEIFEWIKNFSPEWKNSRIMRLTQNLAAEQYEDFKWKLMRIRSKKNKKYIKRN